MEALKKMRARLYSTAPVHTYAHKDMDRLIRAVERYDKAMTDDLRWCGVHDEVEEVQKEVRAILDGS